MQRPVPIFRMRLIILLFILSGLIWSNFYVEGTRQEDYSDELLQLVRSAYSGKFESIECDINAHWFSSPNPDCRLQVDPSQVKDFMRQLHLIDLIDFSSKSSSISGGLGYHSEAMGSEQNCREYFQRSGIAARIAVHESSVVNRIEPGEVKTNTTPVPRFGGSPLPYLSQAFVNDEKGMICLSFYYPYVGMSGD